ncbi:unnamed protein product [Enterobius vermicularis]|uniref:Isochorismatase domain-containing protein 1 n=1 Tax=Enterobius vermicularis TaxID=51028 RepID=A0A0N4VED0_ENTVE|nr:unnamed protein product [Enterobius vermicularis]
MGTLAATKQLISRVSPKTSALFVCDMQEAFRVHEYKFKEVTEVCKRLIKCASLMDMKILATEQNPRGLGHTIKELDLAAYKIPVFEKTKFTMCIPPVEKFFGSQLESVILCGIEGHVCVLQTTLDFLKKGIHVHVVADGITSRTQTDRYFGLRQMERAGAVVRSSESVMFELLGGSDHPKFKEVQQLVKIPSPDTGLLPHFV